MIVWVRTATDIGSVTIVILAQTKTNAEAKNYQTERDWRRMNDDIEQEVD